MISLIQKIKEWHYNRLGIISKCPVCDNYRIISNDEIKCSTSDLSCGIWDITGTRLIKFPKNIGKFICLLESWGMVRSGNN